MKYKHSDIPLNEGLLFVTSWIKEFQDFVKSTPKIVDLKNYLNSQFVNFEQMDSINLKIEIGYKSALTFHLVSIIYQNDAQLLILRFFN